MGSVDVEGPSFYTSHRLTAVARGADNAPLADGVTYVWQRSVDNGKTWAADLTIGYEHAGSQVRAVARTASGDPVASAAVDVFSMPVTVSGAPLAGASQSWGRSEVLAAWGSTVKLRVSDGLDYALNTQMGLKATVDSGTGLPTSITKGALTLTNGKDGSWKLYDGDGSTPLDGKATAKPGLRPQVRWEAAAAPAPDPSENNGVVANPNATVPGDWSSQWGNHVGPDGGVTTSPTPTEGAEKAWTKKLTKGVMSGRDVFVGEPIIVRDSTGAEKVIVASTDELKMFDAETGELERTAKLVDKIDSISRMVFTDGLVVVPVSGGRLQALTVDTLTTVWFTNKLPGRQQSLGTPTVKDGALYFGTSKDASMSGSSGGYLLCVDVRTGAVRWQRELVPEAGGHAGFYWAGSVFVGDTAVYSDDSGRIVSFDPKTGQDTGKGLALGAGVHSAMAVDEAARMVYAVTLDGVLHKVHVGEDGTLEELGKVKFADAVRFEKGEGLAKKEDDFAAEVASMVK